MDVSKGFRHHPPLWHSNWGSSNCIFGVLSNTTDLNRQRPIGYLEVKVNMHAKIQVIRYILTKKSKRVKQSTFRP